jgi:hypothetical protein
LADAAAAALALPALRGRTPAVVAARRAAVHAAGDRMTPAELADALSVDERTIRRLRAQPPDVALRCAVDLQLRLRGALALRAAMPQASVA